MREERVVWASRPHCQVPHCRGAGCQVSLGRGSGDREREERERKRRMVRKEKIN